VSWKSPPSPPARKSVHVSRCRYLHLSQLLGTPLRPGEEKIHPPNLASRSSSTSRHPGSQLPEPSFFLAAVAPSRHCGSFTSPSRLQVPPCFSFLSHQRKRGREREIGLGLHARFLAGQRRCPRWRAFGSSWGRNQIFELPLVPPDLVRGSGV
jgi:hypothetical protein